MSIPEEVLPDESENQSQESFPNTEIPPKPNRLEQFIKAKANKQHPGKDKGFQPHGKSGHAKLKERIRRRP